MLGNSRLKFKVQDSAIGALLLRFPNCSLFTFHCSFIHHMDYIIIGAGAAGLMAANILTAAGKKVQVLEAANRTGGRIHTIQPAGFTVPVETGAEFVHGHLPITFELMEESGISYVPAYGEMWRKEEEEWKKQEEETDDWDEVLQRMKELKNDLTVADFLYQYFGAEKYADVRQSVQRFAEGFDLADIFTASTFALRDEWSAEEEEQYRIPSGYGHITDHLTKKVQIQGGEIITGCRINHIETTPDNITAWCTDGREFSSTYAIVTVSLGILQLPPNAPNAICFSPEAQPHLEAFQKMGFGSVIKIAMQFQEPFWESISSNLGFIFSDQPIPTWWTQLSLHNGLLTGWLAGPAALEQHHTSRDAFYQMALQSLSAIFDKPVATLEETLLSWEVFNWTDDLFAAGAYSFSTVDTAEALKTAMQPLNNKIFFAGEAIYDGPHPGTVEAALESGKQVAEKLLNSW